MGYGLLWLLLLVPLLMDGDDGGATSSDVSGGPNTGPGDDLLTGTGGEDQLFAGAGQDTVIAGAGADTLEGGSGDDRLFGGDGNDIFGPQEGFDSVFGGNGDDLVFSTLVDSNGDVLYLVDSGDDFMRGGAGNDTLTDFDGANTLQGDAGDDLLVAIHRDQFSTDGDDLLTGGQGADTLIGDAGDTLLGGLGPDEFNSFASANRGGIIIEDFDSNQNDRLVLTALNSGPVTLEQTLISDPNIWGVPAVELSLDGVFLAVVKNATQLNASDITVVDPDGNNINANVTFAALDLNGTAGDDTLNGTDDADAIDAGNGNDSVFGNHGADTIRGGWGNDTVNPGEGNDRIFLDSGDDLIEWGSEGDDYIRGGRGEDTILDSEGADTIHGDVGRDLIDVTGRLYDLDADIVFGGFSADTIVFDTADTVTGGHGADRFEVEFQSGGSDVAVIKDFNAQGTDTLVIKANSSYTPSNVTTRVEPEGVYVSLAGEDVVLLEGLTSVSASQIEYAFEDPPDPWA